MSVAHGGALAVALSPRSGEAPQNQAGAERPPGTNDPRPAASWAWLGLHGGAGVTTLAQAVPGGVDLATLGEATSALPLVVVCRSHAGGLDAAQHWEPPGGRERTAILGLVVVADAPGPLPRGLRLGIRLVAGGYRHQLWRIPWVPAWRMGQPVQFDHLPAAVRQLGSDLADRTARRGGK
jgi:hypothetical protein